MFGDAPPQIVQKHRIDSVRQKRQRTLVILQRPREIAGDVIPIGHSAVDENESIVALAREVGWLPCQHLDIMLGDAFTYVQTCHERFDYIAVDLFRGEHLAGRAFGKPFLRRLRSLLLPRGRLAINLFTDIRVLPSPTGNMPHS